LEPLTLDVRAPQFEQGASLTKTLTPLADVTPHVLLLGLLESELKLHAFPPTCTTLIDPP
jgi:hypothetical protein